MRLIRMPDEVLAIAGVVKAKRAIDRRVLNLKSARSACDLGSARMLTESFGFISRRVGMPVAEVT